MTRSFELQSAPSTTRGKMLGSALPLGSAKQAEFAPTKLKIPVLVVSHDPDKNDDDLSAEINQEYATAWKTMQNELTALSTQSTHLVAKGSGHYIQSDSPDFLVSGIRDFINEALKFKFRS